MSHFCKDCQRAFDTITDCMSHDFHEHIQLSLKTKKKEATPNILVRGILSECGVGNELEALINAFYISEDKLKQIEDAIIRDLKKAFAELAPITLRTYGSLKNGLMLNDSDVDISIQKVNDQRLYAVVMEELYACLQKCEEFDHIISLPMARVPIIKCMHAETQFKIDINCFSSDSFQNGFLYELFHFDERLFTSVSFLKIWFKQHRIIDTGLMSSYCFTTLVLFYFQQLTLLPSIRSLLNAIPIQLANGVNHLNDIYNQMKPIPAALTPHQLIREFFHFYGRFNFHDTIISTYLGRSISVTVAKSNESVLNDHRAGSFMDLPTDSPMIVTDSFKLSLNVAQRVSPKHFDYFQRCFQMAIKLYVNRKNDSFAHLYEALLLKDY